MTAIVRSLTDDGRPRQVRFRFDRPLESSSLRWVSFANDRFEPFAPPPVGESRRIEPARGPFDALLPAPAPQRNEP